MWTEVFITMEFLLENACSLFQGERIENDKVTNEDKNHANNRKKKISFQNEREKTNFSSEMHVK